MPDKLDRRSQRGSGRNPIGEENKARDQWRLLENALLRAVGQEESEPAEPAEPAKPPTTAGQPRAKARWAQLGELLTGNTQSKQQIKKGQRKSDGIRQSKRQKKLQKWGLTLEQLQKARQIEDERGDFLADLLNQAKAEVKSDTDDDATRSNQAQARGKGPMTSEERRRRERLQVARRKVVRKRSGQTGSAFPRGYFLLPLRF